MVLTRFTLGSLNAELMLNPAETIQHRVSSDITAVFPGGFGRLTFASQ